MPKFAANLTFLFRELPFLDRFEAAAEAGFKGVEVLFPYDDAASEITRRLRAFDLRMVLINAPPPNWAGGERGFAAVPGLSDRFRHDFKRALRFAERHFARWGWAIVLITSSNPVCLMAGAAGFPLSGFLVLAVVGILVRLVLLDLVGEVLAQPIDLVVAWVADHRTLVVALSVSVVLGGLAWQTRHRRSSLDELRSLEEATDDEPRGAAATEDDDTVST